MRVRAFSSLKRKSLRVFASSVLPTPVGPINKKLPKGLFSSFSPALLRLIASATTETAFSWPITRFCSTLSKSMYFCFSEANIFVTGIPVQAETIFAMSSSETSCRSREVFSAERFSSSEAVLSSAASISERRFSISGMRPYLISAAFARFPSRVKRISSL